ncbi:MAG: hypothetical protein HON90_02545 [Halobacteriovoraceae bacterium]|nr:hypothetical protein [Halobacteriovoraceae bacterium]
MFNKFFLIMTIHTLLSYQASAQSVGEGYGSRDKIRSLFVGKIANIYDTKLTSDTNTFNKYRKNPKILIDSIDDKMSKAQISKYLSQGHSVINLVSVRNKNGVLIFFDGENKVRITPNGKLNRGKIELNKQLYPFNYQATFNEQMKQFKQIWSRGVKRVGSSRILNFFIASAIAATKDTNIERNMFFSIYLLNNIGDKVGGKKLSSKEKITEKFNKILDAAKNYNRSCKDSTSIMQQGLVALGKKPAVVNKHEFIAQTVSYSEKEALAYIHRKFYGELDIQNKKFPRISARLSKEKIARRMAINEIAKNNIANNRVDINAQLKQKMPVKKNMKNNKVKENITALENKVKKIKESIQGLRSDLNRANMKRLKEMKNELAKMELDIIKKKKSSVSTQTKVVVVKPTVKALAIDQVTEEEIDRYLRSEYKLGEEQRVKEQRRDSAEKIIKRKESKQEITDGMFNHRNDSGPLFDLSNKLQLFNLAKIANPSLEKNFNTSWNKGVSCNEFVSKVAGEKMTLIGYKKMTKHSGLAGTKQISWLGNQFCSEFEKLKICMDKRQEKVKIVNEERKNYKEHISTNGPNTWKKKSSGAVRK